MSKFLWLDVEMTGLDPVLDGILEVAAFVSDGPEYAEIDNVEILVKPTDIAVERMKNTQINNWEDGVPTPTGKTVFDMHTDNDLIARINESGIDLDDADSKLTEFIARNFGPEKAVLAGSSIHQDRRFIRQYLPKTEALLHYRMLDVSSFAIVAIAMGAEEMAKDEDHRALTDARRSLKALDYYLNAILEIKNG